MKKKFQAKNLCQIMFYSFPRGDISRVILNTITKIACKSLTNIYETVCNNNKINLNFLSLILYFFFVKITFFIKLLHEEPREKLHLILLKNLHYLSKTVSHLWTNENINNFLSYTNDQKENNLILLRASEILCTLSQNSNVYFYFVFNSKENIQLEDKEQDKKINHNSMNLVDNKVLKKLFEENIFHDNNHVAFNFCSFATTLLVFQAKNIRKLKHSNNTQLFENDIVLNSVYLFDLAKNGLFNIILECDKRLKVNNNDDDIKLLKVNYLIFFLHIVYYNKCNILNLRIVLNALLI
jgi:hypothetical protein